MQHPESPRAAARPRRAPPDRGAPHPGRDGATPGSRRGASGSADGKRRNSAAIEPSGSAALRRSGHRSHRVNRGRAGPRGAPGARNAAPQPSCARSRDARAHKRTHACTRSARSAHRAARPQTSPPSSGGGSGHLGAAPHRLPPFSAEQGDILPSPNPGGSAPAFPSPSRKAAAPRGVTSEPRASLHPSGGGGRGSPAPRRAGRGGGEGRGQEGAERCGRKGHLGSSPPLLSARGRALPPAPLGQV